MKRKILIIMIVLSTVLVFISNYKHQQFINCIIDKADNYVNEQGILPYLNGTQLTIYLEDITNVKGTITYTKYNDEIIKTVEIGKHKYKKEKSSYNKRKNTKVNVYFNYRLITTYTSKYTTYLPPDSIITFDIPKEAEIIEYMKEDKAYYSYRDKKWKWYKNDVVYSEYSASKPDGYNYKDEATKIYSPLSKWSLNYPEEYAYRHILSQTGYKWYNDKIYWNHGAYSVVQPSIEYYKKESAIMYAYYDDMYKWYKDTKRIYSYYSSIKPTGYNYKDNDTLIYTDWSNYTDVKPSKEDYREIKEEIYTRYAAIYELYSEPILNNPITLEELEKHFNKTYEEILNDNNIKLEVIFKFQKI